MIDAGYRGEVRVLMENLGDTAAEIHAGDKLVNLIPYPVLTTPVEVVEELAESSRRSGVWFEREESRGAVARHGCRRQFAGSFPNSYRRKVKLIVRQCRSSGGGQIACRDGTVSPQPNSFRIRDWSHTSMAIIATQMRPGMIIKHNNELHSVFSVEHRTPGNLRAFIQAKLRNLRTGAMFEHRFRSSDAIDKITVDENKMEYLYNDGDNYFFMDIATYEQTALNRDVLGDAVDYLTPICRSRWSSSTTRRWASICRRRLS